MNAVEMYGIDVDLANRERCVPRLVVHNCYISKYNWFVIRGLFTVWRALLAFSNTSKTGDDSNSCHMLIILAPDCHVVALFVDLKRYDTLNYLEKLRVG